MTVGHLPAVMDITCVFFGPLRDVAGDKEVTQTLSAGATVADLVDALDATIETDRDSLHELLLADSGSLQDSVVVTVNKRHVSQLDGPDTPLSDGDTVRLTPSIMGGSHRT